MLVASGRGYLRVSLWWDYFVRAFRACRLERPWRRRWPAASIAAATVFALCGVTAAIDATAAGYHGAGERYSQKESTGSTDRKPEPTLVATYESSIDGVDDKDLRSLLEASSQLNTLVKQPPSTVAGIERRAREDVERLRKTMRSEGYYDGTASYSLDAEKTPVAVRLTVAPGPRYKLTEFTISYTGAGSPQPDVQPSLADLNINLGMPAESAKIADAQRLLTMLLAERSWPHAKIEDRKYVVDRQSKTMVARLRVNPGPSARFGTVTVEGAETVDPAYIQKLVSWQQGAKYDSRKIMETRRALLGTGLFSTVSVDLSDAPKTGEERGVIIRVAEKPHRSIGAGFSYSTDVGVGGEVFWEHRNIFGANETLRASVKAAQIEQSAEVRLRKPAYLHRDQAFLSSVALTSKDTDAFDQLSLTGFVGLERQWTKQLRTIVGLAPSFDIVEDNDEERKFALLGLPASVFWDASDDRLDPTRGFRLDFNTTPYVGTGSDTLAFVTAALGVSAYHKIDKKGRYILAGRARVGSLVGAETTEVPATKRFFSGGGGSVRGYEFQSVGPLDSENDPLGGRSLVEIGTEVRIRLTDTIGIVPFVDGGTVFDESYPTFDETIRWAAGLGLRYHTKIGPVRVDFGFPINGRDDVDDAFQFYISFGQAF